MPYLGVFTCLYLVGPWTGRDTAEYQVGGGLLLLGVVLWALTWFINRAVYGKRTYIRDPEEIKEDAGPTN
jgi:hypothetical protein